MLAISSGGLVSATIGFLGYDPGAAGVATVSGAGSQLRLSSSITVGRGGYGHLSVSGGGHLTSTFAYLGDLAGSEGRVTVSGLSSQWETGDNSIYVGYASQGDLEISGGGEVSAGNLYVGSQATGAGDVTITGSGSRMSLSGSATIGNLGYGLLDLADGAELYVALDFTIGDPAGDPIGTCKLDGGSLYVGDDFSNAGVFHFSDGLLRVVGDFQPNASASAYTIDGDFYDDLPTLDLIGFGTTTNISTLNVGYQLRGQLSLRQGRLLNLGAGNVNVGALASGEGAVTVESGAELRTSGTLAVGGSGATAGGAGTLEINGGTVDVATLRLHSGGEVNLVDGKLKVDSIPTLNGGFNWPSGILEFDANTSLSDSTAPKFLGPAKTLHAGQSLATTSAFSLTLNTSLAVDDGVISAGSLTNQKTLELRSGLVEALNTATNTGLLQLGGTGALFRGVTVSNSGTIRGTGTISGAFTNNTAGQVEVLAGERLILAGASSSNAGHISVIGGELQVDSPFTNQAGTGLVSARDAVLRFAGVTNNGSFAFSNGMVDFYGDITQNVGGRVTVSNGGIANFYDDVTLAMGAANVQATALGSTVSRVVFFGSYNGGVSGGGQAFIEGDHRPGTSPARVTFGGDLA